MINKAENFDFAGNYVLHSGHLGYTAVCSRNGTDMVELSYEKLYLEEAANQIKLDFWLEYCCQIWIRIDGEIVGEYQMGNILGSGELAGGFQTGNILEDMEKHTQLQAGQANGAGALKAQEDWLVRRRGIGFTEICISIKNVPVQKEFALSIQWQGMGKLCFYQFCPFVPYNE